MIPFYIVSALWVITFVTFYFREFQHQKQYMEMLKLYRANSLAEYSADSKEKPKVSNNFIRSAISRAYSEKYMGDEDDG